MSEIRCALTERSFVGTKAVHSSSQSKIFQMTRKFLKTRGGGNKEEESRKQESKQRVASRSSLLEVFDCV